MNTSQDASPELVVRPALDWPRRARFELDGIVGQRMEANVHNWLLTAPAANPAMLQMFRDRDRTPPRDMVPWAGEFAGKYLISAVQALRLTGHAGLRRHLERFTRELVATQAPDGYLGPWPEGERMTGEGKWDLWGQYHVMLGLLLWSRHTGDAEALAACRRCADLFCHDFLEGDRRVYDAGSHEMNESSIHIFCLLHEETGEQHYLQMAREIEQDWQRPPSGDHVRYALAGKPFYQCPKPRWESLHGVQAIAEFYFITGEQRYRRAFEQIWWSIVEGDRHNTGGFSSGEKACGNPYDPGAIETCCTVAWMAITVDMLRMTGDPRVADELELSTFNAVLGAQSPSGRWWTYNTPMDGERKASAHDIEFQARAGSPELNCCSVNAPRGLGVLSEWALMQREDGLAVNYYGPCSVELAAPSGRTIRLEQQTDYPLTGQVRLAVHTEVEEPMTLHLRMPGWSPSTHVQLNGEVRGEAPGGTYHAIERNWRDGDVVQLGFDMTERLWPGERECAGRVSVYQGPLLLAYDPRFDRYAPDELPELKVGQPPEIQDQWELEPRPIVLLRFATRDGEGITLCDFASAGAAGNLYRSWLPGPTMEPVPFCRSNPLRTVAPGRP